MIIRKLISSYVLITLALISVYAQEEEKSLITDELQFSIEWIRQYPHEKENTKKTGARGESRIFKRPDKKNRDQSNNNWLTDVIFGKKQEHLIKPMSVIAYRPDTLWVTDQASGAIIEVLENKGKQQHFKKSSIDFFPSIVSSCFFEEGKILFTDSDLNFVLSFRTLLNKPELHIFNDSVQLDQPTGIAYSEYNNEIWIIETGAHRISILDTKGRLIRRIGERGNAPGQFNYPTHIWIDNSGLAYITDAMNFRVQIFNSKGEFISTFGKAGDASGFMSRPKGIATDSYGHIYIADALFHVVQVFNSEGQFLYDFGGKGKKKGQFMIPTGIYIDDKDYIYVADSYNSRIQVFRINKKD